MTTTMTTARAIFNRLGSLSLVQDASPVLVNRDNVEYERRVRSVGASWWNGEDEGNDGWCHVTPHQHQWRNCRIGVPRTICKSTYQVQYTKKSCELAFGLECNTSCPSIHVADSSYLCWKYSCECAVGVKYIRSVCFFVPLLLRKSSYY